MASVCVCVCKVHIQGHLKAIDRYSVHSVLHCRRWPYSLRPLSVSFDSNCRTFSLTGSLWTIFMTDKRKTNKCGQTQSHDLTIKGHTRNRKCIPLRGGSGSDGPDMQIQERSLMQFGRVSWVHIWVEPSFLKSFLKAFFLQFGKAVGLCVGYDWLEKQQHPTDCAYHRCWIPHGWRRKTGWYPGTKRWTVPSQPQPLHKKLFNGIRLALLWQHFIWSVASCVFNVSRTFVSSMKDYPSVGQLAMQLEKRNIQPIFAVTEEVVGVYEVSKIKMTCIHYHLFKENKINASFFSHPSNSQKWFQNRRLECCRKILKMLSNWSKAPTMWVTNDIFLKK